MLHYNVDKQPPEIQKQVADHTLTGPEFIGQGCSYTPWTDTFGYYIVSLSHDKRIVGLVHADTEYIKCWEDGDMTSKMPEHQTPDEWAVKYGSKWYEGVFNKATGKVMRIPRRSWSLHWNGCYNYRSPEF